MASVAVLIAAIAFAQGVTTTAPGVAMIGTTGSPVTMSNGNNAQIQTWTWTLVDSPPASSIRPGQVQQSNSLKTFTFTPDVAGGYLWLLEVTDQFGNYASDLRAFQVREASGRIIPPAKAPASALNWIVSMVQNTDGWQPYAAEYFRTLDSGLTSPILSNTFGSRPAAGTANRLFFSTNGGRSSFDNGAKWQPTLSGGVLGVQPPSASTFTAYNTTGTCALADANGGLLLSGNDDGGSIHTRGFDLAPGGPVASVEADVSQFMNAASVTSSDNTFEVGVILRDVTLLANNYCAFALAQAFGTGGSHPALYLSTSQWSDANTRSSAFLVPFWPDPNAPLILRVRYASSTLFADISRDRENWSNVWQTSAPGMSPTRVGFHTLGYHVNGAYPQALISHFNYT